ncbi:MAG TPA: hypothetical protein PKC45_04395 [Gemmatales bacterium]|nr:hypothetical protein [Gemmatales bacterium]
MNTQPTHLCTQWTLHFDRDGTEDYGTIYDAEGDPIVTSHQCQTCWLPECKEDEVPALLRQMQMMVTAPRLLNALIECARLLADHDEAEGEEGDAYREALSAIAEATGRTS